MSAIDFSKYEGQLRPLTRRDDDVIRAIERQELEELVRAALKPHEHQLDPVVERCAICSKPIKA